MRFILCFRQQSRGYKFHLLWIVLMQHACVDAAARSSMPASASLPTKVIVVLNGLWQDINTFDVAVQSWSKAFIDKGLDIQVCKIVEMQTSALSIGDQAKNAFFKIQECYSGKGYEIILIGHSQGGLRAAKILALNQEANYPLNIKGLVTLAAPWQGSHLATITAERIKQLEEKTATQELLKLVKAITKTDPSYLIHDMEEQLSDPKYYPTDQPGVQDMNPGNKKRTLLHDLQKTLESNTIPILIIAGWYKDQVAKLLPPFELTSDSETDMFYSCVRLIRKLPLSFVNIVYGRFLVGSSEHDMVVPLHSQLANGLINKYIKRHTITGAVHAELPGLIVPKNKVIYNHPKSIELIVEFVKEQFSLSS